MVTTQWLSMATAVVKDVRRTPALTRRSDKEAASFPSLSFFPFFFFVSFPSLMISPKYPRFKVLGGLSAQ